MFMPRIFHTQTGKGCVVVVVIVIGSGVVVDVVVVACNLESFVLICS